MARVSTWRTSTQVVPTRRTCCCYSAFSATSGQVFCLCTRDKFRRTPRQLGTHVSAGESGASVQGGVA
jgi:hypothetical protein